VIAATATCRVCGSQRNHLLCRNRNEHSRTLWLDSFRCDACGSVFVGNEIAGAELAEAYAGFDHATYYRETAAASAAKFAKAAKDIARFAAPPAAILDIGGGDGAFLCALKEQGFAQLSLHEIPGGELPDLSGLAAAIYRDEDYASLPAAAFDIVTLMDVIEHVRDPGAAFAAARRALRQGGFLYVHTPVVTVLDRLMQAVQRMPLIGGVGRAWQRARTSIFHLQIYTPQALRALAQRNGFDVTRLDTVNELSWPVERYVRIYLAGKAGLPAALIPVVAYLLAPLLRSRLNANKAVLVARAGGA
jgi:2-polyprenyl-3-methyl-5-hydroxy-6-metoxy-1,4-benzoquinol methylase